MAPLENKDYYAEVQTKIDKLIIPIPSTLAAMLQETPMRRELHELNGAPAMSYKGLGYHAFGFGEGLFSLDKLMAGAVMEITDHIWDGRAPNPNDTKELESYLTEMGITEIVARETVKNITAVANKTRNEMLGNGIE